MKMIQGKKLLASLVAAAAAVGIAAGGSQVANAAGTVSIKVTGEATKNRTYKAIKLADYTDVDTSGSGAVTLSVKTVGTPASVKTDASTAVTAAGASTSGDPMAYVADHWGSDSRTAPAYSGALRNFVMALANNADIKSQLASSSLSATSSLVGTSQYAEFTGLENGIYLIVDSDSTTRNDGEMNTLPILVSTKVADVPDAKQPNGVTDTVEVKANFPGKPKKTTGKRSYNIGQMVPFTIKTTVPTYTNFNAATYVLKVSDKLSKGLTYDSSKLNPVVKIKGVTLTKGTDYTIDRPASATDPQDGPAEFTFNLSPYIRGKMTASPADYSLASEEIEITYEAMMNADAISQVYPDGSSIPSDSVHNDASVEFTNDPYSSNEGDTSKTPNGRANVYTYKMTVNKVDKASGKPLEGAKFSVTGNDGTALSFVKNSDGSYRTPLPGETGTATVTSPQNGTMLINGLSEGTYTLEETAAPDHDVDGQATSNYKLIPGSSFKATISPAFKADEGKTLDKVKYEFTADAAGLASLDDADKGVYTMRNVMSLAQLPLTGAYGIAFLVTVGVLMVLGGGLLYMSARKKEHNAVAGEATV
jgi:fimbrial isopeptide formation D2 family protein/LPXTG-motif cell wall-anchored protein